MSLLRPFLCRSGEKQGEPYVLASTTPAFQQRDRTLCLKELLTLIQCISPQNFMLWPKLKNDLILNFLVS